MASAKSVPAASQSSSAKQAGQGKRHFNAAGSTHGASVLFEKGDFLGASLSSLLEHVDAPLSLQLCHWRLRLQMFLSRGCQGRPSPHRQSINLPPPNAPLTGAAV